MIIVFLNQPLHTPGRDAALALLRERYPDIAKFNSIWSTKFASWDEAGQAPLFAKPPNALHKSIAAQNDEISRKTNGPVTAAYISDCDAFLALVSERYFHVTFDAVKAADSKHLVLGCRFAYTPAQVRHR